MTDQTGIVGAPQQHLNAVVLDDDAFDRQRLCRMVRKLDMNLSVVAVSNISEMMATVSAQHVDVFLIDYRLQDATGLDALEQLQDQDYANATKIMLSGFQQTDVAVAAMQRGCADFIGKDDLTPELLKSRLQSALSRVEATVTPSPADIDVAMRKMAQQHLPLLLAEAFGSGRVQESLRPYLETLILETVARALVAHDDHRDQQSDPGVRSLLGAMGEEVSLGHLTNGT